MAAQKNNWPNFCYAARNQHFSKRRKNGNFCQKYLSFWLRKSLWPRNIHERKRAFEDKFEKANRGRSELGEKLVWAEEHCREIPQEEVKDSVFQNRLEVRENFGRRAFFRAIFPFYSWWIFRLFIVINLTSQFVEIKSIVIARSISPVSAFDWSRRVGTNMQRRSLKE